MNTIDKRELQRKLRAAVAMLLVSTVLLMNSSYAWLVLATAPEVTGVTSVIGANGNLEIALATTEHLRQLQDNDMYEPEDAAFVMANGDAVHDNVLWGNLLDLSPDDYGLQTLNLRPSMLNTVEGEISQFPVYIASYGEDGRIGRAAAETKDLYNTCLTALFDKDLYRSIAGSTKLFRIEADAGLLDDEVFLEDMLANVSYGLRLAGPIELKSRQDPDDANFVIVD